MPGAPSEPKTEEERCAVASDCVKKMKLTIPFLIDNIDNRTEKAYKTWPDRIYVISKKGKIVYKAGRGPWGFKPKEAEKALIELLKKRREY